MTDNPHLTPQLQPDDAAALRPKTLAEFIERVAAPELCGLAAALTASMELP